MIGILCLIGTLYCREEKPAQLCEVENAETGEKLQIPCTTIAPPTPSGGGEVEQLLEGEEAENGTKHCSKTVSL